MPVVKLEQDENGELILPLTDPIFQDLGWDVGDVIEWVDNGDGSWSMVKQVKTKLVMVETVSSFKIRYVVEIPEDAPEELAHDYVLNSNDPKEFSQKHISEEISGSRTITKKQYIKIFDEDNEYLKDWPEDAKLEGLLNKWNTDEVK